MAQLTQPDKYSDDTSQSVASSQALSSKRASLVPSIQTDDVPRSRKLSRSSFMNNFSSVARRIRSKVTTLKLLRNMAAATHPAEPEIEYENSYHLSPTRQTRFVPDKIQPILERILEEYIHKRSYDAKVMPTLACSISTTIKNEVKRMNFNRYKLVCHVTLMQNQGQPILSASQCIWDVKHDNVAVATYQGLEILAVISVYGLYYD